MDSTGAVPLLQVLSTFRQQTPAPKYSYLVKFIQAKKKSNFMVRMWHDEDEQFSTLTGLRLKLMDYFQDKLPATTNFKLGYFEPPNNSKRWFVEQHDLQEMYRCWWPESLSGVKDQHLQVIQTAKLPCSKREHQPLERRQKKN